MLLETTEERLPAVVDKVFSLAESGERWACELVIDRALGKQREFAEPTEQPAHHGNLTL